MSTFKSFRDEIKKRIDYLVSKSTHLYTVDTNPDESWEEYMNSFPSGTNEIHKERRAYECNSCRQFIRPYAGLVAIIDGKIETIWDVTAEGYYQDVADYMNKYISEKPIANVFVPEFNTLGVDKSDPKAGERWFHFHYIIPDKLRHKSRESIYSVMGEYRSSREVFKRALEEISVGTIETVIELINNKSVERGDEFLGIIQEFKKVSVDYHDLEDGPSKDIYTWCQVVKLPGSLLSIRNSSIGTLLVDIEEGEDLEVAVIKHGKKVSGANYKRPKNQIITKRMHDEAVNALKDADLIDSLSRRYAVESDISVNDVIYVDKSVTLKESTGNEALDLMLEEISTKAPKNLKNVSEMSLDDFINNVIPGSEGIELLVENDHINNLASITAGKIEGAKNMFKWNNDKAWTYNKGVADSIKEDVAALGGNVSGVLRYSIRWFNNDDYDAHCVEPKGNRIYYSSPKNTRTTGELDVDIITPSDRNFKGIVENITWTDINKMESGEYVFEVNNFTARPANGRKHGFIAEIEYNDKIWTFRYDKAIPNSSSVEVARIHFSPSTGVKILSSLTEDKTPKDVWGIKTNTFQKVNMIMNSPNHWESEKGIGNKHTFFILDGCINQDENPRAFYNEFLKEELTKYRKFFEVLGSKVKLEDEPNQLSGLGFSSSRSGSLTFKVSGKFSRMVKVNY